VVVIIVSKIRFGNCEYAIITWVISIIPLLFIIMMNAPLIVIVLVFASVFIGMAAIAWLPMLIGKYRLRPAIDKCGENETTWCRVTKDRIIIPQFVSKGPYGQTKGVVNREKADVVDDGSFPCKWLNGNSAIMMYYMMNTNIDLRKSVARKKIKFRWKVRNGVDAYKKAVEEGEVMYDE